MVSLGSSFAVGDTAFLAVRAESSIPALWMIQIKVFGGGWIAHVAFLAPFGFYSLFNVVHAFSSPNSLCSVAGLPSI
jgi:hypothetical protein